MLAYLAIPLAEAANFRAGDQVFVRVFIGGRTQLARAKILNIDGRSAEVVTSEDRFEVSVSGLKQTNPQGPILGTNVQPHGSEQKWDSAHLSDAHHKSSKSENPKEVVQALQDLDRAYDYSTSQKAFDELIGLYEREPNAIITQALVKRLEHPTFSSGASKALERLKPNDKETLAKIIHLLRSPSSTDRGEAKTLLIALKPRDISVQKMLVGVLASPRGRDDALDVLEHLDLEDHELFKHVIQEFPKIVGDGEEDWIGTDETSKRIVELTRIYLVAKNQKSDFMKYLRENLKPEHARYGASDYSIDRICIPSDRTLEKNLMERLNLVYEIHKLSSYLK